MMKNIQDNVENKIKYMNTFSFISIHNVMFIFQSRMCLVVAIIYIQSKAT